MPIRKYQITLTDAELALCKVEAEARVMRAVENGAKHRAPETAPTGDPYNLIGNIRGRLAEVAVAKYLIAVTNQMNHVTAQNTIC